MIRIARASQRRKFQSATGTTRPCLSPLLGEPDLLEPLLEVNERTIVQNGEESRAISPKEETLLAFIGDNLQVSTDSVTGVRVDPGSLAYISVSGYDEVLTYRNLSGKPASFLEIVLDSVPRLTGSVIARKPVDYSRRRSLFCLAGEADPGEEVLPLNSDCSVYVCYLRDNESLIFETNVRRQSYCLILEGAARVGNERLIYRDVAFISGVNSFEIAAKARSTIVLVDLPNRKFFEGEAEENGER